MPRPQTVRDAVLADTTHEVMHKPEVRVVYRVGMFTGQRFKNRVLLKRDSIDLNRRRIWAKRLKTGKEMTIPIAPKRLDVLVEAQVWKRGNHVYAGSGTQEEGVGARTLSFLYAVGGIPYFS